jgi:hypothetical protein
MMDAHVRKALAAHRARRWKMPKKPKAWLPGSGRARPRLAEEAARALELARLDESLTRKGRDEAACKATRAAELDDARSACELARAELKEKCAEARHAARARGASCLAEADGRHQDELASYWRDHETRRRMAAPRRRRGEALGESDDAVRAELGTRPELLPVWEKVKGQIRARPGMSRAEAFEHWTEEHPDEVTQILAALEPADDELARAERAYYEAQGVELDAEPDTSFDPASFAPEPAPAPKPARGRGARGKDSREKALADVVAAEKAAALERDKAHALELQILDATSRKRAQRPLARMVSRMSAISDQIVKAQKAYDRLRKQGGDRYDTDASAEVIGRARDHWRYVHQRYEAMQERYSRLPSS